MAPQSVPLRQRLALGLLAVSAAAQFNHFAGLTLWFTSHFSDDQRDGATGHACLSLFSAMHLIRSFAHLAAGLADFIY